MLFKNLVTNIIFISGFVLIHLPVFALCLDTDHNTQDTAISEYDMNINEENFIKLITADSLKFCVIVRYPVHANKLTYLKNQIEKAENSENAFAHYKKLQIKAIEENSNNFNTLYQLFTQHFDAVPFYFLPDSSFKSYNAGISTLFVNNNEVLDAALTCPYDNYYFVVTGKDEDQLLFVTRHLSRAPEPLPYKKNIFLPSFKKIFNRNGYLTTQIKYFNEQLKKPIK